MKLYVILFILIIIIFVGSFVIWYRQNSETHVREYPSQDNSMFKNQKKLDEIRNREIVKRRQELIVQEVYLIEEKDRINKEKENKIKEFDNKILKIETQLESIRKEKLPF